MPFIMAFNFGAAILRSMGDTRRPLYILVMAGVVNTLLNLLFVIGFGMGVAGVAIATGIANAVSATLIIRLLRKEKEPFRLHFDKMKIHGVELSRMLRIGVPAGVQGMIFSISNVVVQSSINSYGADAIAGSSAALNFEYYCYFIIQGFNGAAISFIAQNYGAGRMDRVHRVFWICMGSSLAFCAAFNWLFAWQDDFFLGFFSDVPMVHHFGAIRMHIVLACQFIASSYEIAGSSLRGMGKSLTPAVLTVFGTCLLRIVWVYGVSPVWRGYDVLMMVYPVSWVVTGLLVLTAYWLFIRKKRLALN
jgi:putative MATE family efflux protein